MGLPKASLAVDRRMPRFDAPASIFDLLNLTVSELIGISGSLVTRICESDHGITREEWQFVAMLASLGPLSPSDLAAQTTVDRSQVSKTLKGLVQKKLVQRQPVPGDGRRVRMVLSVQGQAFYERLFPRMAQVHDELLAGFSPEECQRLAGDLVRIQGNALRAARKHWPEEPASRRQGGSRRRWMADAANPCPGN